MIPDATADIEAAVDRVDHALGLLIDKRHSPPVTNAIKLSLKREGEKLYRHHGHDALVEAAMLVVIRNPKPTSRNNRIALLEALWATIDTQQAQALSVRAISTAAPCLDMATPNQTEISIMKKEKKKTKKAAKRTKRIAAHKQSAAVKRST
jgi:hypothetical protein